MEIVKIKAKNQITIPVRILQKLNLSIDDNLNVEIINNRIVLEPVKIIKQSDWNMFSKEFDKVMGSVGETPASETTKTLNKHTANTLKFYEELKNMRNNK